MAEPIGIDGYVKDVVRVMNEAEVHDIGSGDCRKDAAQFMCEVEVNTMGLGECGNDVVMMGSEAGAAREPRGATKVVQEYCRKKKPNKCALLPTSVFLLVLVALACGTSPVRQGRCVMSQYGGARGCSRSPR